MTTTTPSRAATSDAGAARNAILEQLIEDHKRVRKAYRDFRKLEPGVDDARGEQIVQQVLQELTVHAALEEELLYPAARDSVNEDVLDEAEVEHESLHALIDQLRDIAADDDKYAARFTVLCEYVLHHVKEEEGQMFPQLARAKLDWEALKRKMDARRAELTGADDVEAALHDEDQPAKPAASKAPAASRSGAKPQPGAGRAAASTRRRKEGDPGDRGT